MPWADATRTAVDTGTCAHCNAAMFFRSVTSKPQSSASYRERNRGPWTNAETTFSNEYFRLLVEERWSPKLTHNGKPWTGPDQYEDATGQLMMLPSDMALLADPEFKKWVEVYAKNGDRFATDFAKAFAKLLELGVPFPATKPWYQFW